MKYKLYEDAPRDPFREGEWENHSLRLIETFDVEEDLWQFISEYTTNVDPLFCPMVVVIP